LAQVYYANILFLREKSDSEKSDSDKDRRRIMPVFTCVEKFAKSQSPHGINPARDGMCIDTEDVLLFPLPSPSGAASYQEWPSGMAMSPRWGWEGISMGADVL
jgi:hypothetical protein